MAKLWHFLSNTFLIITEQSTKLLMTLSPDHRSRLNAEKSDPDILALLSRFIPLDDALVTAWSAWYSATAFYKGATDAFEALIAELVSTKLKAWMVQTQAVYPEGTPEYITLFPSGMAPFNSGPYELRINSIKSLGDNLATYIPLAATKLDVDAFYTNILNTRSDQQTKEEIVRTKSSLLDTAKINVCDMMYGNLGKLMDKFKTDPEQAGRFFDLSLIINPPKEKDTYSGLNDAGVTNVVVSEGIISTTIFKLYNNGDTRQKFFTSNPGTGTEGIGMELPAHTNATATAESLGNVGDTQLNVKNLDPVVQGSWSVVVT